HFAFARFLLDCWRLWAKLGSATSASAAVSASSIWTSSSPTTGSSSFPKASKPSLPNDSSTAAFSLAISGPIVPLAPSAASSSTILATTPAAIPLAGPYATLAAYRRAARTSLLPRGSAGLNFSLPAQMREKTAIARSSGFPRRYHDPVAVLMRLPLASATSEVVRPLLSPPVMRIRWSFVSTQPSPRSVTCSPPGGSSIDRVDGGVSISSRSAARPHSSSPVLRQFGMVRTRLVPPSRARRAGFPAGEAEADLRMPRGRRLGESAMFGCDSAGDAEGTLRVALTRGARAGLTVHDESRRKRVANWSEDDFAVIHCPQAGLYAWICRGGAVGASVGCSLCQSGLVHAVETVRRSSPSRWCSRHFEYSNLRLSLVLFDLRLSLLPSFVSLPESDAA
ncbi:hypothetical protein DFJ74DRAFT_752067, partial [Hyaloraphidium curvatum]